jgi:hypothetical protein
MVADVGDPRQQRARDIQHAIRNVLYRYWDPIGVAGEAPPDEYDRYIGGVYRLLIQDVTDGEMTKHLRSVSPEGFEVSRTRLAFVVKKLRAIDVHIGFVV